MEPEVAVKSIVGLLRRALPAMLPIAVKDREVVAETEFETVMGWSLVRVKMLPVLEPGPITSGAPAPLLLMVTLPVVLAVRLAAAVQTGSSAPATEVREKEEVVRKAEPVILTAPLALTVME